MDSQPATAPGDHHRLARLHVYRRKRLQRHPCRAGQQRRLGQLQPIGQHGQAVLRDCHELGKAAMSPVADALAVAAAVFAPRKATVALATGVGEQRHHPITGTHARHAVANLLHHAGEFVSQHHTGEDTAPQESGHDQAVVVAEPAGCHPHQRLARARLRHGQFHHRQAGRHSGTFEHERAHCPTLYALSHATPTASFV